MSETTPSSSKLEKLDIATNLDVLTRFAKAEFGIEQSEVTAILKELTEFLSKKGELQQLEVLKNYLEKSTQLKIDAKNLITQFEALAKGHKKDEIPENSRKFFNLISKADQEGMLLEEDHDDLNEINEKTIAATSDSIATNEVNGRLARQKNELDENHTKAVSDLIDATEAFEKDNTKLVSDIVAKIDSGDTTGAFDLIYPQAAKKEAQGKMTVGTRGGPTGPFTNLIQLVAAVEKLEKFGKTRNNVNLNKAFKKRGGSRQISDNLNKILNLIFQADPVDAPEPRTTTAENLAKEVKFYSFQVTWLESIQKFMQDRPIAINAVKAFGANNLGQLLGEIEAKVKEELESATEKAGGDIEVSEEAKLDGVNRSIDTKIQEIAAELPKLRSAVEKRLNVVRRSFPDVHLGRTVGVTIHNLRQLFLAILALATLAGGAGLLAKNVMPDEEETRAALADAWDQGKTAGETTGHAAGVEEGKTLGEQETLNALATALELNIEGDVTQESIIAALTSTKNNENASLESAKADLNSLIDFLVEQKAYKDKKVALKVAGVDDELDSLDQNAIETARETLLRNLVTRALTGDNSATAVRVLAALRKLDTNAKARVKLAAPSIAGTLDD